MTHPTVKYFLTRLLLLSCLSVACDHGLAPPPFEPTKPGFGGVIRYVGNWPPPDSLKDLRLVAFLNFPPQDIVTEVLSGQAKVYPPLGESSLPFNVDSTRFEFFVDSGTYQYVAVAQQYGTNLFTDWKAVGLYSTSLDPNQPATVTVPPSTFTTGIDIVVDFDHPPRQPFISLGIAGF
jgi:hypothetical protein